MSVDITATFFIQPRQKRLCAVSPKRGKVTEVFFNSPSELGRIFSAAFRL